MAKAKKAEVIGTEEAPEMVTTTFPKVSFDVYTAQGGYVRTYSLEQHGENAEALANQYASKIAGSVK